MNCREAARRLAAGTSVHDPELEGHLASCQACSRLAGPLGVAAMPDPARLAAMQQRLGRSLKPVKPLRSPGRQAAILAFVYAAVAIATAALIGFSALPVLRAWQMIFYFGAFVIVAAVVAGVVVQRLSPGLRPRIGGASVLLGVGVSLGFVALILFPDFGVANFAAGIHCLETGCAVGLAAAIVFALVLRRTFASDPVSAGASLGFFAALCGTGTLALHCPVLAVPHILVWHLGTLVIGPAVGAGVGWLVTRRPWSTYRSVQT